MLCYKIHYFYLINFNKKKQNVDQQTGNYFNENFEFDEKIFNECVNIEIKSLTDDMLVFDVQGIDFAFANALRRLMTSDVETIAPEKIHLFQNTSVVQDEILAHRIGLIPLKADPKHLQSVDEANPNDFDSGNSIELELKVKCTQKADGTIENRNGTFQIYFGTQVHFFNLKFMQNISSGFQKMVKSKNLERM